MVTYPHANTVAHNFCLSLLNLDRTYVDRIIPTRGYPGTGLIIARNAAVEIFLRSSADWLLTLDTDIGFPPDLLDQMLAHAQAPYAESYSIISGFYKTVMETGSQYLDGSVSFKELPLALKENDRGRFGPYEKYEGAMEVDAVGAGCLLVHREVFDSLGSGWYDTVRGLGEDISFCVKARQAGYKILCDTDIELSHFKSIWLRGK